MKQVFPEPDDKSADGTATTTCPQCAVGCTLRYDEQTGRATGVEGASVNREGRLCPKGISAFDGLDDGRLTHPLIRVGETLEPVSWERAYDRIEAGFRDIIREHGPEALAFLGAPRCTNEENYLFAKLARVLGTNTIDNRARSCHESVVSAMTDRLGSGGMTNSLEDIEEADVFLVVGSNPAAQQPIAFNSHLRPAINDGATLIHIDPRANRTTRTADIHLAPYPGADALLVTLLASAVLEADLTDHSFVEERTTGFTSYAEELRTLDIPTHAERAGVEPEKIRTAARAFGRADRAAVLVGTGIEGEGQNTAPDALLNLVLLTGNLGRRGTGMNLLRGLVNEQGANDMGARPTTLPGYREVSDPEARSHIAREWGVEPPTNPGLSELDAVQEFGESIRGTFVLGENPAISKLDDSLVEEGFESLDFLLVQDISASETTAYADVVLPASAWAEKEGTVTNLDRQVQLLRPTRAPPENARHDREILEDLGTRLTDVRFEYDSPEAIFEEITAVNPLYAGMEYEKIGRGSQRWPFPEGAEEGTQILHRERFANGKRRAAFIAVGAGQESDDASEIDDDALTLLTRNRVNESEKPDCADNGTCWIHPSDARTRDLEDGDNVVVAREEVAVHAETRLTADVRTHTVFLDIERTNPFDNGDRIHVHASTPSCSDAT